MTESPIEDAAEIARLAALPAIQYDRERDTVAERLGCRVGTLDEAVKAARGATRSKDVQGKPLELPDPEPWPEPVDGAALLEEIAALVRSFVILSGAEADTVALWVVHSHALDVAQVAPRLVIKSPEKRCGKTTLLSIVGRLVRRPLPTSNITAAALFRTIETAHPTLLIDEGDTFISGNDEMRGVLNSGHTRAQAFVIRTVGDDHEPRRFSTWASIALAAIGNLPATLEDRSVVVNLRRRRPDEHVGRLRLDRLTLLDALTCKAARWVADHLEELRAADPVIPSELHDRAADNWRPLLAIADVAGEDWPQRARWAATELTTNGAGAQDSEKTMLLADIRDAFENTGTDRLASQDLVGALVSLEDRPWGERKNGKPLTKNGLARLLKAFLLSPGTIRLGDGKTPKGYYLASFEDAFARYLSPQTATPPHLSDSAAASYD